MFSGIVSHVGRVVGLEREGEGAELVVEASLFAESESDPIRIGDSIATSGVCLTVTRLEPEQRRAWFDLSSETLRCTALGSLTLEAQVNLERSVRVGDRLDGHLVLGHVDAVSEVLDLRDEASTRRFELALPAQLARFIAPKGSICLDGVSLTVGEVGETSFSVYIIPHTLQETTATSYAIGSSVNVEVDCVARYVARAIECRDSNEA